MHGECVVVLVPCSYISVIKPVSFFRIISKFIIAHLLFIRILLFFFFSLALCFFFFIFGRLAYRRGYGKGGLRFRLLGFRILIGGCVP